MIQKMHMDKPHYDTMERTASNVQESVKNKNGTKIFEGDIVKFEDVGEEGYEYKEGFDYTNMAKVIWNKGRYELDSFFDDNSAVLDSMNECPDEFYAMFEHYSEVIGNIFDNPELLEEKHELPRK